MEIKLTWMGHDGFLISSDGITFAIDPYRLAPGYSPVRLILVTHDHYDHYSPDDIEKLSDFDTTLVAPSAFRDKIRQAGQNVRFIDANGELTINTIRIQSVAAYNSDKHFHTKDYGGTGYLIQIRDRVIYHAGDTDRIPEMKDLGPVHLALLPVSGTYVMTAEEAVEAARDLNCEVAVPMHFGAIVGSRTDAETFCALAACHTYLPEPNETLAINL